MLNKNGRAVLAWVSRSTPLSGFRRLAFHGAVIALIVVSAIFSVSLVLFVIELLGQAL